MIDTADMDAREFDFRIAELCMYPGVLQRVLAHLSSLSGSFFFGWFSDLIYGLALGTAARSIYATKRRAM